MDNEEKSKYEGYKDSVQSGRVERSGVKAPCGIDKYVNAGRDVRR